MRSAIRLGALALALATAGCATIDIYNYQPRALPAGLAPLTAVEDSLRELRDVSWSYGAGDPNPARRARLAPTATGIVSQSSVALATGLPLDLSYVEIADGVRMVTQLHGSWTVYLYDRHQRTVQLEFRSYSSARLFLDGANALAQSPVAYLE